MCNTALNVAVRREFRYYVKHSDRLYVVIKRLMVENVARVLHIDTQCTSSLCSGEVEKKAGDVRRLPPRRRLCKPSLSAAAGPST
jgi:hypothetical protein